MITQTVPFNEAALTGRLNFINTGTGTAVVEIYGNTRPATASGAPIDPPLVVIDLQNPAGVVNLGTLELFAVEPALILNSGLATWARVKNRNGDTAFDMDAGAVGSGAEAELSQTTLFAGGLVSLVSAVLG